MYGGANQRQTPEAMQAALDALEPGDILLLQNEINGSRLLLEGALRRGVRTFLNPAPFTPALRSLPLDRLDTILMNQSEAAALTGADEPMAQLAAWARRCAGVRCVLTLGERGVLIRDGDAAFEVPAPRVQATDTTGAGDTFIGYYVAGIATGADSRAAAERAVRAAALCVQRPGAMDSIPPATTTDHSPARIPLAASITARIPEPHTLWRVIAPTLCGRPA